MGLPGLGSGWPKTESCALSYWRIRSPSSHDVVFPTTPLVNNANGHFASAPILRRDTLASYVQMTVSQVPWAVFFQLSFPPLGATSNTTWVFVIFQRVVAAVPPIALSVTPRVPRSLCSGTCCRSCSLGHSRSHGLGP